MMLTSRIFLGISAVLALLLTIQTVRVESYKQKLEISRGNLVAEIAKHEATKQAYRDAQAEAEVLEKERLTRVLAEQKEITNERSQSYERRIAAARADAERLRSQLRAGASGSTGDDAMSSVPDASGRADATAGDNGFSIDERLTATKQAIQLDELITWVQKQVGVRIN